jgi:PHP family Zn ribbon phosphoesterase
MTPNNIANMSVLKELDIIAVCDHNSVKNCEAVAKAAKNNGLDLLVIPGLELTTSEEIHVLVYFSSFESAHDFDREVLSKKRVRVKNNAKIFGDQIIMNEFDEAIGEDEHLLINAADISIDEIFKIAENYEAAAVPAHIDKDSNGLLAILGDYPDNLKNKPVEIRDFEKIDGLRTKYQLSGKILSSSDAHYLWDIAEPGNVLHSEFEVKNSKDFIKNINITVQIK